MNDVKKSSLFSWLLFDLANTVYAFVIPGLYFSVWLVSEKGWTDQQLGFATSTAMVVVAITGPLIGKWSDRPRGKKPLLLILTIVCIVSTFLLGTFNVSVSVFFFIMSLIGFNLGSVVYDSLLVSVSNEENRGKISGLGVAFGYIGSLIGFFVATLLQNRGFGFVEIFRSVAFLFLIFSLPAFIFIKEKKNVSKKEEIDSEEIISELLLVKFDEFTTRPFTLFIINLSVSPLLFLPIITAWLALFSKAYPLLSKYFYQIYKLIWKILLKIPIYKQIVVAMLIVVKSWIHTKKYKGLSLIHI